MIATSYLYITDIPAQIDDKGDHASAVSNSRKTRRKIQSIPNMWRGRMNALKWNQLTANDPRFGHSWRVELGTNLQNHAAGPGCCSKIRDSQWSAKARDHTFNYNTHQARRVYYSPAGEARRRSRSIAGLPPNKGGRDFFIFTPLIFFSALRVSGVRV